jgi:DNA-binding response OmpR family regulator
MNNLKRTILIVDDSEISREMVRYTLTTRGYEVITVDSPFSFGGALSRAQADLVLVDAHMPALSGDKLVEVAIQNRLCTCPIVFYSERPAEELSALVRSSGASGYIQKSNDPEDLVMAVEDYLAGSRARHDTLRPGRDSSPPSQRSGPTSKVEQSGVYSSSGPASSRMRGGQKP